MKVAKLVEPRKIELFDEEVPERKENNDVLVKVKAVGICGSDLHYFRSGGLGSHKLKLPVVLGHEVSGVVEEVGSDSAFKHGDRVAIDPQLPCGHCKMCEQGLYNLCENVLFIGTESTPGANQEYIVVKEEQLLRLENKMSFEEGVMLEPLAVAVHATDCQFHRYLLDRPTSAAIFGAGPIGLLIMQVLWIRHIRKVYVVDAITNRVVVACVIGDRLKREYLTGDYHCSLWSDTQSLINDIRSFSDGGVNVAFEAAGGKELQALAACIEVAKSGGRVIIVGIHDLDMVTFNPHIARKKELAIFNVRRANKDDMKTGLAFVTRGDISFDNIITHRFKLDDVQHAFETAAGYKDNIIKGVIIL